KGRDLPSPGAPCPTPSDRPLPASLDRPGAAGDDPPFRRSGIGGIKERSCGRAMNRERHRDQALRHGLAAAILLVPSLAGNALARPERQAPGCLYARSENGTSLCIRAETYGQDICTAVGHFAERNGLPADFFARLIWKESLFRAD